MSSEAELKPCPFCNAKAVWREFDERDPYDLYGLLVDHDPNCFLHLRMDWEGIADRWNTRTPDPATLLAAIGKALKAAVGVCGSGKNEAWSYDSCWGAEQVRKNILALDPATILAGLTEAQADG